MPGIVQAQSLEIEYLIEKFSLRLEGDPHCFIEWQEGLPELSEDEIQELGRIRERFEYLGNQAMVEEVVKLAFLSPLLDLAGMLNPPFRVETETSVELAEQDGDVTIRGKIDVLVLNRQFWVLVVESKRRRFAATAALPQALFYMLNAPGTQPVFSLVSNGEDYLFVKLVRQDTPHYALSRKFTLLSPDNELARVLRILKRLAALLR